MMRVAGPVAAATLGVSATVTAISTGIAALASDAAATNPMVWIGLLVTVILAALPTVVAWGKLTERLNSVQKSQEKMVSAEGLGLALERMKNEMLEKLLKAKDVG